ncbi:hypothetical protein JL721_8065 [Aureococcus anophagefferens]|nr:hypothetical protein JL721_8065 [Aureococcus anophagefferens]
MSSLSSSYAKWDAMDVSDDEQRSRAPDAAQEAARVKAMSDGDRANWRAAGWLHSRAGDADEAGECARRSASNAVHDELESVASDRDWQERWSSDGEKRRRIVEARLRRTPAIGAEVRLPPCAADFALEILWCWGEAVCLFHAAASTALGAAKKPGATTLDDPHWKVKLGGWSRDNALDDLRRDLDDLRGDVAGPDEDWVNADARRRRGVRAKLDPGAGAGAETWRDWVALCSKRSRPWPSTSLPRTPRHPDLARFRGNALVAWYPIRVLSDRSPTTLRELAKRSSSFAAFVESPRASRATTSARRDDGPAPDHLAAVDPRRAAKGDFDVGTHVALCRLSRDDLNGQRGVVERRVAGGRCGVRLPGHPKLLAIRAANLIPLAAPVPHPPQKRTPRPGGESTVTVSLPGYAGDPPPDAALVDVPSKSADAFAQEEGQ